MSGFLDYWRRLLWRALKDSWGFVLPHSGQEIFRTLVWLIAPFLPAYAYGPTLVRDRLMSADNIPDGVITLILGLAGVGVVLLLIALVHVLFVAPYRMWREARDSLPPAPQALKLKVPGPKILTPHAVERKLKAIDGAVDILKDAQSIIDQGPGFMRDPWHNSQATAEANVYGERVATLSREVQSFADQLDQFRAQNQEYADIAAVLEPTFCTKAREKIGEYMNAAACVELAIKEGATLGALNYLFANYVGGFEQGIAVLARWRDTARVELGRIRSELSAV